MATEGASEQQFQIQTLTSHGNTETKCGFDIDNISKPELLTLLSILEGELEARDLVIEALRARRKEVFIQERYGRFNLSDPFLALQRDYEAGGGDKEKNPICTNPLTILEAVMAHCRKMQERMSAQLSAAESRQKKLEMENSQLRSLEQEHKKVSSQLEKELAENKFYVRMLVMESKQLASKAVEEKHQVEELTSKVNEEKRKTCELEDALAAEKQKSLQIEAKMEKQLSDFDTEREQLRAKFNREEMQTLNLRQEIENLKKTIENLKKENENKQNLTISSGSKDGHYVSLAVGTEGPILQSSACQTDVLSVDNSSDGIKKSPLAVPVKPSLVTPLIVGNTKVGICPNTALVKPISDRQHINDVQGIPLITQNVSAGQSRSEENGPSIGPSPDLTSGASQVQTNPGFSPLQTSGITNQNLSPATSVHCLHSPTAATGLSPRIQAARFRFQASTNDHDQNGTAIQSPPSRDLSPTNRDNLMAKQLARNTVTQVLSRFTSPQGTNTLRPGLPHSGEVGAYPPGVGRMGHPPVGIKSPTVTRVGRGNPPPIPPKKPGLSQTPSPPHPQLKVIIDGSRSPNIGLRIENKNVASPPSSSPHGIRAINEEILLKPASPQLPPKPTLDIPVASAGCAIPAIATSQVGAWPSPSPGLNHTACSESSFIIPTTTACSCSISPVSASSCRPCDSDSLLVTASGWSPSLTPLLTCGGPVLLGDRSTLLHQAAAQGNVTLLSMLLNEEGIDVNYSDEDSFSALYSAAKNGHADCMMLLLSAGAHVDITDNNGFTPLCLAAAQGHFKCLEILITHSADINHASEGGQTPLFLACANGNNECIKLLLEAGADQNAITNDCWTVVHAAVFSGHADSLKLLMYYKLSEGRDFAEDAEMHPLSLKSSYGDTIYYRKAESVLSAKLINYADKGGWTAAHIAASKGFKKCLEILCCHSGLELEKKDKCNRTAHDVATDDCKHLLEKLNVLKITLQIFLNPHEQIFYGTEQFENEIAICALNLSKQTNWDDVSSSVSQAVADHFQSLSEGWGNVESTTFNSIAETSLGLSSSSVSSFQIGDATLSPGQVLPFSPWEVFKKSKTEHITVNLFGLQEGCVDSLAYAALIPLPTLQNYLRLVEQYLNIMVHGPEGSFQDYIALQIACCIKQKQEARGHSCEIVEIKVDIDLSKEQLVEMFISNAFLIPVNQAPGNKNVIIILENLEQAASLSGLLGDLLEPLENRGPGNLFNFAKANGTSNAYYFQENAFLIGTIAKSRLQGSDLLVQQHFRWVQLRWDREPIHGMLQRFLKRKVIDKFKGQMPLSSDPLCQAVEWVCTVWHQLNSCLSRLGTPEALLGPRDFFSCPVIPGQVQPIMKWMSRLWNAIIAPRVEEAILSRTNVKRPSTQGQLAAKKNLNQGQQAVVKAALRILLNKAVLHGYPPPRQELDQYILEFQGGSFPLSVVSSYKTGNKKKDNGSWRKVSTSPRKKSGYCLSTSLSKHDGLKGNAKSKNDTQKNFIKKISPTKQKMSLEQRLSLGSDDEHDLMLELQSMCSSKSESDISKIGSTKDNFNVLGGCPNGPLFLKTVDDKNGEIITKKDGVCPFKNVAPIKCSSNKTESTAPRVKSHLPVPLKNTQRILNNKSSSSNTRQKEVNSNREEI
ncbi:cortactin-binding protein 2 isoform X1 [Latimeria chalumnae]|uniref:cortactin-binding protein 2 isoform X1 n=1 Tax=Latimeria chalumnae TaxID=7897 RepID=UPI00313BB502